MKKVFILCIVVLLISFSACVTQNTKNSKSQCGECPQFVPPPPDWCKDGTIVPSDKDECGCQMPPKCEKK